MRNMVVVLPMPNHTIARGSHDMPGTERMSCTKGSINADMRFDLPERIPVGMPMIIASEKPPETRNTEAEACFKNVPV